MTESCRAELEQERDTTSKTLCAIPHILSDSHWTELSMGDGAVDGRVQAPEHVSGAEPSADLLRSGHEQKMNVSYVKPLN